MKSTFKHIVFCFVLMITLFSSCTESNVSDLKLEGDCLVELFSVDNYDGMVDLQKRTIIVRVPETYNTNAMEITSIKLSDGATANMIEGDILQLNEAKVLKVTNGDTFINWTIIALRDMAKITSFVINDIYNGIIDQDAKTITVYIPGNLDIAALTPTITYSTNAQITPLSGNVTDFSSVVTYNVVNGTAQSQYEVKIVAIDKPKALFVGSASNMNELDIEAKTACLWMLANVSNSLYASFADIQADAIDLSECKVIWWHYHKDGGVDGHDAFVANASFALDAKQQLRNYYENGGSFFLTRYATNLPSFIGATNDDEWTCPNNCWGQNEDAAELCGGPWTFKIFDGQNGHPLYQNLVSGDNASEVYCTDAGYHITNSTAQYHIGTDWGGYDDYDMWCTKTSGVILGNGGDGAIVAWEYPTNGSKGTILCIGSGCYDWYSYTYEAGYTEKYHKNIEIMTHNAFNYLMNE